MVVYFDWRDVLNPLAREKLIGGSMHRYLRELVASDIQQRLEGEQDGLSRLMYLEALKMIYAEDNRYSDLLATTRQELYRLKRKYRRQISRQRKQLLKQYT